MIDFVLHVLTLIGIFSILAISLDVTLGYTGLFNIGHAAFWGIGAYVSSILTLRYGIPFLPSFFLSGIIASISSMFLGLSVTRVKGDYLALVTLGFGVIFVDIARNLIVFTGGATGLSGIPSANIFGIVFYNQRSFVILVFLVFLFSYFFLKHLMHSPFGRVLEGIREDEISAKTLGINVIRYKIQSFMISSFFAGISGSLYAHYNTVVNPEYFTIMESFAIISMVIIGGTSSLKGAICGAAIYIALPELVSVLKLTSTDIAAFRQIVFSIIILLILIFRPQGIISRNINLRHDK